MHKIGLIREGKVPQDTRVPLNPRQAKELMEKYPEVKVVVQKSPIRCYADDAYREEGLELVENVNDCDLLLGVKEVPVEALIADKTYMFFSHTIKKQSYNRKLLRTVLEKNIRLIDYETLTDEKGIRLIGFGRFAGIVGAHYALLMWGEKKGYYKLKQAVDCYSYHDMILQYLGLDFHNVRVFVSGNGRVSKGAVEVLEAAGIKRVDAESYRNKQFDEAVYVQCDMDELYEHKDGNDFDFNHFFEHPEDYRCTFNQYLDKTDVLINGMYWDPEAERLFEKEMIRDENFKIKVISDISCDIDGSVPITTRATTTHDPVYGYDPETMGECDAYKENSIDMMTVDNLPNELPKDASDMFGEVMKNIILPYYFETPNHKVLRKATIAVEGRLTNEYRYLEDYVND